MITMKVGKIITLSGIDGSGKSTYGLKLKKWLDEITEVPIYFIDGIKPCNYSDLLRNTAKTINVDYFSYFGELSLLVFALDLLNTYENRIKPLLEEDCIIITHRNELCCKTYSKLRDFSGKAEPIINTMLQGYEEADVYFYLEVSPLSAMERIEKRKKSTNYKPSINENYECLTKLAEIYENKIPEIQNALYRINTDQLKENEVFEYMKKVILENKIIMAFGG